MTTLKERLEELMADYGLTTQQQLADFAEVSKGLVGQWFNGSTGLGKKPLLAFERKTNFSAQWLSDGTGNKYKEMPMHESMNRLYQAAEELMGIKGQSEIAKRLNASPQTVKNWETRGISKQGFIEIQKVMGISIEWLETGEGEMRPRPPRDHEITDIHAPRLWSKNDPLPEDEYTFAPYLKETEFTGGSGSFEIPDYNGFRLPFGKSTLYRKGIQPDKVFCCTLNGDSMEPRIDEGAAIGVDTGDTTIKDGKIYAFRHDDLFRVKYLHRIPGGRVIIKSQNPAYGDEEVGLEDIVVIGRVFWWGVLD